MVLGDTLRVLGIVCHHSLAVTGLGIAVAVAIVNAVLAIKNFS
jgi:hypothetical protein